MPTIADLMTGCHESPSGIGAFYDDDGVELTREQAQDKFIAGEAIAVPNAGAGSYEEVFAAIGYPKVEVVDQTNSGGDWVFALNDDGTWRLASQENRYPYHGFLYAMNEESFGSFEEACDYASM